MKVSLLCLMIWCCLGTTCTKVVVKKGFDFSTINTVAVPAVPDESGVYGSGMIVERFLIHQLMKLGINTVERSKLPALLNEASFQQAGIMGKLGADGELLPCDALLLCTISEFRDSETIMIPVEIKDRGRTVTEKEKSLVSERDSASTRTSEKLLSTKVTRYEGSTTRTSDLRHLDAVVGLSLQLVDIQSGSIVWSSNYSYNSLKRSTAIGNCVRGALKPLRKVLN